MRRRDEIEMARAKIAKAVRSAIRLRYSLMADEEVNRVLPDVLDEYDKAVNSGKKFELEPGKYYE